MTKINVKQQIIIITIAIGLISVIIAALVIIPTIKEILSLEKNINDTQKFLEQEYQKTQRMRRSVHNLDATIEKTKKFKDAIVKKGDELLIITQLETLAANNNIEQNIRVQLADPETAKISATQAKLPKLLQNKPYYDFAFANKGSFEDHISYMRSLEKLTYYFSINSIQWQKNEGKDNIDLRFNAKLYITE